MASGYYRISFAVVKGRMRESQQYRGRSFSDLHEQTNNNVDYRVDELMWRPSATAGYLRDFFPDNSVFQ